MADLCGKTMLQRVYENCKGDWERWILIPSAASEDVLWRYVHHRGLKYLRGSMDDVLSRYMELLKRSKADSMVRVCADAPFLKAEWIDAAVGLRPVYVPQALHAGPPAAWRQAEKGGDTEHAGDRWFSKNGVYSNLVPSDYLMVNTQEDLDEARRRLGCG